MRILSGNKTLLLPALLIVLTYSIAAGQMPPGKGYSTTHISLAADMDAHESGHLVVSADEPSEENSGTLLETGSAVMAEAIVYLRDLALQNAKPIPTKIKQKLTPFFDPLVLEKVRYTTEWSPSVGAALRQLIDTEKYALAVTLDNVIVFSDEESLDNLWLWAHELKHVEQYSRWGIKGFALNYLMDHQAVEQEANDYAGQVIRQVLTLTKK